MGAHGFSKPYRKLKFEWKKAVNKDPDLSGAAKWFASHLCDTYVNNDSGLVWPKQRRLADDLCRSVRSIERYYKELEAAGYLVRVKVRSARKAFQIAFPKGRGHDIKHDTHCTSYTPKAAHEPDKTVAFHKNQGKNQAMHRPVEPGMKCVLISEQEAAAIEEWRRWLETATEYDPDHVFNLLGNAGGYHLPCRYPSAGDHQEYLYYFHTVLASEGKCFS